MAKKQDLKILLDSDLKKTTDPRTSKILEQTIKKPTKSMEIESMKTEINNEQKQAQKPEESTEMKIDQIIENPMILEYQLTEVEAKTIEDIEKEQDYFLIILNVITKKNDKAVTTFTKDNTVTFHIICAATEIFSKLSSDFSIQAIAQDLSNFLPQKIYSFSYESKLKYPFFEIVFQTKAVLEGIFRIQVIFTVGQVEYFCVYDNCIFRVI